MNKGVGGGKIMKRKSTKTADSSSWEYRTLGPQLGSLNGAEQGPLRERQLFCLVCMRGTWQ